MPSFDFVSRVDEQEVRNAVAQANREIGNRFDLKGSDARVELAEDLSLTVFGDDEFKVEQVRGILVDRMTKRGIDTGCLDIGRVEGSAGGRARQAIRVRQGIDEPTAKKIAKLVKESKLKVQTSIQGDQVRVSGKKRDDLQQVIALIRKQDLGLPVQSVNLRD